MNQQLKEHRNEEPIFLAANREGGAWLHKIDCLLQVARNAHPHCHLNQDAMPVPLGGETS
jgi:hypothetical protein